jgi:hypothetical protein
MTSTCNGMSGQLDRGFAGYAGFAGFDVSRVMKIIRSKSEFYLSLFLTRFGRADGGSYSPSPQNRITSKTLKTRITSVAGWLGCGAIPKTSTASGKAANGQLSVQSATAGGDGWSCRRGYLHQHYEYSPTW